jgi:predicted aminopeptidase
MVSSLLRYDSISLANTVVHELYHNTLYLSGQAMFNESLATFVGGRGAIAYFCGAAPDQARCTTAEAAWRDELLFGGFLSELVDELEALYGREDLTSEEKIAGRELIFSRAQVRFAQEVTPRLEVSGYGNFSRAELNNAYLIARRIYYRRLDLFEAVHQALGGELSQTIQTITAAARAQPRDPYGAIEALLPASTAD